MNKISIITLTYKNWDLLAASINSVESQIITDSIFVEYLILDDGTVDFNENYVLSLLENLQKNNNYQIKIIKNKENIGTVKSFNKAIKNSTGDIIIPLAADDKFYDNNVITDIIKEFESTNNSIITGIRIPISNNIEQQGRPKTKQRKLFKNSKKLLNYISLSGNIISGASTYYHRKVFETIGYFDESYRLVEDYPFYLKALDSNINIHLLERPVIKYGTDGVSSQKKINPYLKSDFIKVENYKLTLNRLNKYNKRYITGSKIFNEKITISSVLFYPDVFIRWLLK